MRVLSVFVLAVTFGVGCCKHPHIMHIVADDLGYNDMGWNDPNIPTPNLSDLANNGVILKNLYGMSACSPSRAAMFTGKYASNIGVGHFVLKGDVPHGVPTHIRYLPARLKEHGYKTYGVGKWHQGFCNTSYIPSAPNRGFDHWYGFYKGGCNYYEHTGSEVGPKVTGGVKYVGYDLRHDGEPVFDPRDACVYTSVLFERNMLANIEQHDPSAPMYQYCAFQLPHTPRVVPQEYFDRFPDIVDPDRRTYYGQISYLDDIVGRIVDTLKKKGMYEDTLFVFHSDNGGDVKSGASNHPYRGNKGSFFEGGFRLVSFVSGKGIEKTGYVHDGMFHITDLHPTIIEGVIGWEIDDELDGLNAWEAFSTGAPSPRTEMLITVDTDFADRPLDDFLGSNVTAIRVGDWKLIVGIPSFSYTHVDFGWYPPLNTPEPTEIEPPDDYKTTEIYLFNLKDDPYEEKNLAAEMPDKVAELREKLKPYEATAWTFWADPDPASDPRNYNHFWETGWC